MPFASVNVHPSINASFRHYRRHDDSIYAFYNVATDADDEIVENMLPRAIP